MNGTVDISLIVALRSGVRLALKHIQRILIVIGIVTLSIMTIRALSALLIAQVDRIPTTYHKVLAIMLFVLASLVIYSFSLWYFEEILRIVRGHTRSFARLKDSFTRGWQLLVAQIIFTGIVVATVLFFIYPISLLAKYVSLPNGLDLLLSGIPSLYIAARLCLYPFFVADGKHILDSLHASWTVTHKHVFTLIPMGVVRLIALPGILVLFMVSMVPVFLGIGYMLIVGLHVVSKALIRKIPLLLMIPAPLRVGLALMVGFYLSAIFDLAMAHMYQRLTHPDQAAVPPGVHPLD